MRGKGARMESGSQMHKHSLRADPRMVACTSKTESRSKITALGVHLCLGMLREQEAGVTGIGRGTLLLSWG